MCVSTSAATRWGLAKLRWLKGGRGEAALRLLGHKLAGGFETSIEWLCEPAFWQVDCNVLMLGWTVASIAKVCRRARQKDENAEYQE
ncbi:hypothetical protein HYQ46_008171 [Verticillium longisporum]|nr:hypothetical protein HYQ46_008171 [Verticillium longisporum]